MESNSREWHSARRNSAPFIGLLITAAVVLGGCGGAAKPAAESSSASASSASSAASSAPSSSPGSAAVSTQTTPLTAPAKGDKPNRDFVVGKWGTNGDCAMAIDLRPDGTSDGPFGNWTYSDGVIGFADEPDFRVSVTIIDDKTMQSSNDGKTSTMTRCL